MYINPFAKAQQQVAHQPPKRHVTEARLKAIAANTAVPRVRVVPTREELRWLKHPNGMRFRSEGSVEWPMDSWTHRRLRDGDIKIVEQVAAPSAERALPPQRKPAAPAS
jgi:hypothetical protein